MEPVEFKSKILVSFSSFNVAGTNRFGENYAACKCREKSRES